ncbi:hypothetical protein ANO14919_024250 [Xylariales sp. No.14919]|nr:hypothetical protein ANO14919_024250 [Xylariales sp. No.14919]
MGSRPHKRRNPEVRMPRYSKGDATLKSGYRFVTQLIATPRPDQLTLVRYVFG